jgi:hypothetical protein
MNMLSSGELILSNTTPPQVLYNNSAFENIVKKIAEKEDKEPTVSILKLLIIL